MRHFSLEKWTDFANQNVTTDEQVAMQKHLDTGCSRCNRLLVNWSSLKDFASRESKNEPPRDALAFVKSAFLTVRPTRTPRIMTIFAQLVFDSGRQAAPAGVRRDLPDTRSLLYKAGPVFIDLSVNTAHSSGHIALLGQVMDSETKTKGIEQIPLLLQSGQETLARTVTNEFGEFALECEARRSLQLSVGIGPKKDVLIVLDESVWVPRQSAGAGQ